MVNLQPGPAQILIVFAEHMFEFVQHGCELESEPFAQLYGTIRQQLRKVIRETDFGYSLQVRGRASA